MDNLLSLLKSKTPAKTNKNIHSEVHYWTDVISSAFGERKKFAMYLGTIKRIGVTEAQKIFNEIKDSKAKEPGKLFMWKAKEVKTNNVKLPITNFQSITNNKDQI